MTKLPSDLLGPCGYLVLVAVIASLAACYAPGTPEYRAADDLVLCSVKTGAAYFVRPGDGDNSYVQRMPSIDVMCAKLVPKPQPAASAASSP